MQAVLRRTHLLPRAFPRSSVQNSRIWDRPILSRTIVTKRYTEEHEWVSFDDSNGIGIVSITNHAQSALGDVVFVELPAVGTEVSQGDQMGAVESVKAASDIYAPVSGTVEAVNEILSSEPGLLNKSPEDKGWLCKIKLSNPSEMEKLLTEEEYKVKCEE
ncbi:glycine cleavage system H-protein subunit [Stygiomarasmius scandens]|uniref:Glycine cleavage system H protein n=1 Tax=Marasmiellus scandens TaxID=2682957 RepID=A0ABR1JRK2_9AGAR